MLQVLERFAEDAMLLPGRASRSLRCLQLYSLCGGAADPLLAGKLAESFTPGIPFYVGAVAVFASIAVLFCGRSYLTGV